MINWKKAALLVALTALVACDRDARSSERMLSEERFIETNVALRQIDRHSVHADSLREAVLAEHSVTEEQLRAFVTGRSDRPGELATVWDEINRRLLEAEAPDTMDLEGEEYPDLELPPAVQRDATVQQGGAVQPDTARGEQPPSRPMPARIRRAIGRPALETVP